MSGSDPTLERYGKQPRTAGFQHFRHAFKPDAGACRQGRRRLNLYDTASHQVSHFVPLKPGEVGIYVCGATVQSSPHIGHIRAAVAFDIVRRWFLKLGYKVTFVRNVTDIDDKILDKAATAGQRWWARAYYYEREFTERTTRLACCRPPWSPAPPAICRT